MFSKMIERNTLVPSSPESAPGNQTPPKVTAGHITNSSSALGSEHRDDMDLSVAPPPFSSKRPTSQGLKRPHAVASSSSASNSPNPAMNNSGVSPPGPSPRSAVPPSSWGGAASSSSGPKILRPTFSNPVSCSIHCPGVQGFPSLSCTSCQSMFHPTCVGLLEGADYERNNCAFYCNGCQPPPGKENSNPFPARPGSASISRGGGGRRRSSDTRPSGNSNSAAAGKKTQQQANLHHQRRPSQHQIHPNPPMLNGDHHNGTGEGKTPASGGAQAPLRPIEAQTIVSIGGFKYLVVPQPQNRKPIVPPGGATAAQNQKSKGNEKLPFLLRPQGDSNAGGEEEAAMPTFEIEETPEGKLLLVPTTGPLKKGDNPFGSKRKTSSTNDDPPPSKQVKLSTPTASASSSSFARGDNFSANLSAGYSAMLQVFKFLNTKEKMKAAKVCKLWRDMVFNPELWTCVSLKVIQVNKIVF